MSVGVSRIYELRFYWRLSVKLFAGLAFVFPLLAACHNETVKNATQLSERAPDDTMTAVHMPSTIRSKPAVRLDVLTTPPNSYINSMPPYQNQDASPRIPLQNSSTAVK